MKIQQAVMLAALKEKGKNKRQVMTAEHIARQVFQLAAAAGHPFENITPKQWASKWLASAEFVRMTIPTTKAALPSEPKNKQLVQELRASASLAPIVVDLNKQGIGRSPHGFTPQVIVVDGKHRHRASTLEGKTRIEAWVGVKAVAKVVDEIAKIEIKSAGTATPTKLESAAVLAQAIPRQDKGTTEGSAPHIPMPGVKGYKLYGHGAGGLGGGSGANPNRMGFGAVEQDPSDEENDPSDQAPGAGGGKRLAPSKPNMRFEGKKLDKMLVDAEADIKAGKFKFTKKMMGVAPPGREAQVRKLKEKYGEDSPVPFKIAWHEENGGK